MSELFDYHASNNCQSYAYADRAPTWSREMPQNEMKSNCMKALKEGMHQILHIDPKYNPFLWRELLYTRFRDCDIGLDARVGSTMYVGPKISWKSNVFRVPFATELKWVPVLRSTEKNKASYVMFRCGVNF